MVCILHTAKSSLTTAEAGSLDPSSCRLVALRPAAPSTPEEPTQRLGTLCRLASIISMLVLLATKPIKVGIMVWLRIFDGVPTTS